MGRTVLIVGGGRGARTSLESALSGGGYRVLLAEDGGKALSLLSRDPVDLVLLDARTPGADGRAALRAIRESRPLLPVVMIPGPAARDAAGAVGDGPFDVLEEPVVPDKLRAAISRAFEAAVFQEENYRDAVKAFEKEYIERKLRENGYNVSRTAERLGVDRTSIHRKMKRHGIRGEGGWS